MTARTTPTAGSPPPASATVERIGNIEQVCSIPNHSRPAGGLSILRNRIAAGTNLALQGIRKRYARRESQLMSHLSMKQSSLVAGLVVVVALFSTGCAGPEKKLGRGINNLLEPMRLGEMGRTVEQTALWEGPDTAYTKGFIRGFNRTVARTAVGAWEVITFPFAPYEPKFANTNILAPDHTVRVTRYPWGGLNLSADPIYPASYKPGLISDSTFSPDSSLGFSGGDVAPFLPFSRFRVFDSH